MMRHGVTAIRRWSFLRHPGLAQSGEISAFVQCMDLRRVRIGLQMGDTCKKIAGAQPAGFSEFGGSAFAVTFEGIGRRKVAANVRLGRHGAARFFEPPDRLVGLRLQQMHDPNLVVTNADQRIAGAEADGLLRQWDHLLYRPGIEFAPREAT